MTAYASEYRASVITSATRSAYAGYPLRLVSRRRSHTVRSTMTCPSPTAEAKPPIPNPEIAPDRRPVRARGYGAVRPTIPQRPRVEPLDIARG